MSAVPNPLFRQEVLERRASRLHGDVNVAIPISWQLIGFSLLASIVAAVIFISIATYSRVETVSGTIVLDRGLASILPTRAGIVTGLQAREGQRVLMGDPLLEVRSEESISGGGSGPGRVLDALERQDLTLAGQSSLTMSAAAAERSRLSEQIVGLQQETSQIDDQIRNQRRLVEVANDEFRSIAEVADRGFISQRDRRSREEAYLGRRQQLSQLEQLRSAKVSQLAEARRSIAQVGASSQAQAAGVASTRAEVAQRRADVEAVRGYVLNSPIAGTVTAVTARVGQPVSPQGVTMVVVPDGAVPRAELYVPTNAAGFLAIGQEVRLAIDAFPYQRYGTTRARISEISSVAIPRAGRDGNPVPVYLVVADLSQSFVLAFGRQQPLLPGMALNARIVTEKQSLLEWLFEPLFAVRAR